MDNSHVALVAVKLEASGFKRYRCDRSIPLGVNLGSLTKVLKCAKDDDILTLKAGDDADILSLTYEAKSACFLHANASFMNAIVHSQSSSSSAREPAFRPVLPSPASKEPPHCVHATLLTLPSRLGQDRRV